MKITGSFGNRDSISNLGDKKEKWAARNSQYWWMGERQVTGLVERGYCLQVSVAGQRCMNSDYIVNVS